jgi:hypothetical protein
LPDTPSFERLDDRMQASYDQVAAGETAAACRVLRQKTTLTFGGEGLPLKQLSDVIADLQDPAPPLAARRQKVGRNEPCPCGSGKKFKPCCGRGATTWLSTTELIMGDIGSETTSRPSLREESCRSCATAPRTKLPGTVESVPASVSWSGRWILRESE